MSGVLSATFWFAILMFIPGYVIGSISSGFLVGKIYRNVDLRRVGSGSTGATNTLRSLGPGAALLVAVLDILKGVAAVWLAKLLVPETTELSMFAQGAAAIGAVAAYFLVGLAIPDADSPLRSLVVVGMGSVVLGTVVVAGLWLVRLPEIRDTVTGLRRGRQ